MASHKLPQYPLQELKICPIDPRMDQCCSNSIQQTTDTIQKEEDDVISCQIPKKRRRGRPKKTDSTTTTITATTTATTNTTTSKSRRGRKPKPKNLNQINKLNKKVKKEEVIRILCAPPNHHNCEEEDDEEPEERRRIKNPKTRRKHTAIACVRCWQAKTRSVIVLCVCIPSHLPFYSIYCHYIV